ncbi:MAG: sulfotransferase [Bacteroidota bacterium]|nr:sulfotransferase [Bacteroidota bacterium]
MVKKVNYPNLYIVGAPKSGTTSLYHYLDQHPDITIPDKEPRFFIKEVIKNVNDADPIKEYLLRSSILEEDAYQELFQNSREKIRCDASTQYLFHHKEVIPQIQKVSVEEPKILIMLRNPVDRAFSNYQHNLSFVETLSFEQALEQEKERVDKQYNSFWYYKGLSQYADGVKAYLSAFENVKVVFFEDFTNDTNLALSDIFKFLEVDASFNPSEFLINKKSTGTPKVKWLNNLFNSISKTDGFKKVFYTFLGKERTRLIKEIVFRKNLTKSKVILSDKTRRLLEQHFKADIIKLKEVLSLQTISWLDNGTDS